MIDDLCRARNPLVRDGTSQASRTLAALDPTQAPVDGRDVAQWLEYLRRLAGHLKFFAPEDRPAGDWTPFFERDASAAAAQVATWDAEDERRALLDLAGSVVRANDLQRVGRDFGRLVDSLFALAARMDRAGSRAVEGLMFPEMLRRHVRGGLQGNIKLLVGVAKTAEALRLLDSDTSDGEATREQVLSAGLSVDWWWDSKQTSWTRMVEGVEKDERPFGTGVDGPARRLALAAEHLLPVIENFARALAETAAAAKDDLRRSLADWPRHEPPMALLLAFLQLFRHARAELDGLTGKHLEYHFRDVLGLQPRLAAPDRAFVTFQLARRAAPQVLPAGSVVLGGKDPKGVPLRYALERPLLVGPAGVGAFRAIRRNSERRLVVAETSDPAAGIVAEASPKPPPWPGFGEEAYKPARIGFAVASPLLALSGGKRTITVKLVPSSNTRVQPKSADVKSSLRVAVTAVKDWKLANCDKAEFDSTGTLVLELSLRPDDPPVVPHDPAKHGDDLDTPCPVCRVVLVDPNDESLGMFVDHEVSRVELTVQVYDAPGVTVETENGRVNPAKPFMPFGPQPLPGSRFSVRCGELAEKPVTSLALALKWLDPGSGKMLDEHYAAYPSTKISSTLFTVDLTVRSGGDSVLHPNLPIFPKSTSAPSTKDKSASSTTIVSSEPNGGKATSTLVTIDMTAGDIVTPPKSTSLPQRAGALPMPSAKRVDSVEVVLSGPPMGFGHSLYPERKAQAVQDAIDQALQKSHSSTIEQLAKLLGAALSNDDAVGKLVPLTKEDLDDLKTAIEKKDDDTKNGDTMVTARPEKQPPALHPPLTPRVAGLTLNYTATATSTGATSEQSDLGFFHVHPFGTTSVSPGNGVTLLPAYPNEGELYIGLADAQPQQQLHLLFRLKDGGDLSKAAPNVTWEYLGAGQKFNAPKDESLADGTTRFTRSGLVVITLPPDASREGGPLPAGLHWLRVSASEDSAALCNLVNVHAQAAEVVLLDPDEHAVHLARPLPANRLQKLERNVPAIKKVWQPLPTFDGRAPETAQSPAFIRRASERLRHKRRAITPHDYETLVLEQFPSLHKVRCLNHTRVTPDGDVEVSPGSVTVVVIPAQIDHSGKPPFTSMASLALRGEVEEFLRPLMGPFVRLQVANPDYEPIRLVVGVRFMQGEDPALGTLQLEAELNAFLSPWSVEAAKDIVFGGAIHRSTLIGFVGGRPYVDVVTDFRILRLLRADGPGIDTDEEVLTPRSARGVLVSAGDHTIIVQEDRP